MQQPDWKAAQAAAVTDPARLLDMLALGDVLLPAARAAAKQFPLRVPHGFIARMRRGDPGDPLLRQVLPLDAELETHAGYGHDPVGEHDAHIAPGLLQKYAGRVLLTTTGACGVHCRYCFRRHFPYSEQNPRRDWSAVVARIADDDSIHEVILSGGDPFTLDTPRLREISAALSGITHVRRLRIHTRQPVVLPERVDAELLDWLAGVSLDVAIVIHANHANEIDASVRSAMTALKDAGATLLNQSVLLRGVNDSAIALAELSEALFAAGVLPYYLHLLDPVAGAAHFNVPESRAREIMNELHARVSGYLVPKLVREVPDRAGKTLINL
ncbi:MAG TPA: EF-P beta-lysylation protein EpmB [Gammaproteobacteria bacterium]